jgi:hypothetical protein
LAWIECGDFGDQTNRFLTSSASYRKAVMDADIGPLDAIGNASPRRQYCKAR